MSVGTLGQILSLSRNQHPYQSQNRPLPRVPDVPGYDQLIRDNVRLRAEAVQLKSELATALEQVRDLSRTLENARLDTQMARTENAMLGRRVVDLAASERRAQRVKSTTRS